MPETYGKRERGKVKTRKAAAKEERRLARAERRAEREAKGKSDQSEADWLGERNPVGLEDDPEE